MNQIKIAFLFYLNLVTFAGNAQINALEINQNFYAHSVDLSKTVPLEQAYAHNDYWQRRPLWSALSKGFTALEVDVHLLPKGLIIAHTAPRLFKRKNQLSKQYLKPLWKLYKMQKGLIYPNYKKPILLIIDIKTDATSTYKYLLKELEPYHAMLTRIDDGELQPGAITIIISGNRPVDILSRQKNRYLFMDGRISEYGIQFTNTLAPIISDNWNRFFGHINGHQKIPKRDVEILKMMVELTHSQGKKLRFWNTPESKNIWSQLLGIGVDYINTDQLEDLSAFLIKGVGNKE